MSSQEMASNHTQKLDKVKAEINELFKNHPEAQNNDGVLSLPADALVAFLREILAKDPSSSIMSEHELDQFAHLLNEHPGINVTVDLLQGFVVERATATPEASPPPEAHEVHIGRGRPGEKTEYVYDTRSRSSSGSSIGTSVYRPQSRPPSRGPPVPPKTPTARDSPFDVSARQRTTPLASAPSSWARRPPPSRRKSDAGSQPYVHSDSEVSCDQPCFGSGFTIEPGTVDFVSPGRIFALSGSHWTCTCAIQSVNTRSICLAQLWCILPNQHRLTHVRRLHLKAAFSNSISSTHPLSRHGSICR